MVHSRLLSVLAASCFTLTACGAPDLESESVAQRFDPIIGGTLDTDEEHDAIVLVYSVISSSGWSTQYATCTGALIAPNVVLTARHCVSETSEMVTCKNDVKSDREPSKLQVVRGYKGLGNVNKGFLSKGRAVFHDGSNSLCGHDIALIVLEEDDVTKGSETQLPIVPMPVRVHRGVEMGEVFTASGYGLTNEKDPKSSGERYRREGVTVTGYAQFTENVDFKGTQSICQGDSGGPAVSAQGAIMGVTSRGENCTGSNNFWVRTDPFKSLIDDAVREARTTYTGEDGQVYDGLPMIEYCYDKTCRDGLVCAQGFHGKYCTETCDPAAPACPQGSTCDAESSLCLLNEPCESAADCSPATVCIKDRTKYCAPKFDAIRTCPVGFDRLDELGVCTKPPTPDDDSGSGGCSQHGGRTTPVGSWLGMLIALGWLRRRSMPADRA